MAGDDLWRQCTSINSWIHVAKDSRTLCTILQMSRGSWQFALAPHIYLNSSHCRSPALEQIFQDPLALSLPAPPFSSTAPACLCSIPSPPSFLLWGQINPLIASDTDAYSFCDGALAEWCSWPTAWPPLTSAPCTSHGTSRCSWYMLSWRSSGSK